MSFPLHVEVALALGWRDPFEDIQAFGGWSGYLPLNDPVLLKPHCGFMAKVPYDIPKFDTDWRVTGPLIERFRITIEAYKDDTWSAQAPGETLSIVDEAPLLAVCRLLKLKKALP